MSKPSQTALPLAVPPGDLAASAVNNLVRALPTGSASFRGIVLLPLLTGHLVHPQGSLARAAVPSVVHLRWGWPRVERALERGKGARATLGDPARTWCLGCLPLDPVRWGSAHRTLPARDSAPSARLRANQKPWARLGKGDCQRAQRAGPANRVAALTTVARGWGGRGGRVGRPRCGASRAAALAKRVADLPERQEPRLGRVAAGLAPLAQAQAAPAPAALVGRWRRTGAVPRAPQQPRPGQPGRPRRPGPVLPPGAPRPAGRPDAARLLKVEGRAGRVRRGHPVHFARAHRTLLAGVRVEEPAYKRPLLSGPTAPELTAQESRQASGQRWPGEPTFLGAQGTCARARPRAWSERAGERRISVALLWGALRKAIAAACPPLPMGPWDRKAVGSAGRWANHLALHAGHFVALALKGLAPRTYGKSVDPQETTTLPLPLAA